MRESDRGAPPRRFEGPVNHVQQMTSVPSTPVVHIRASPSWPSTRWDELWDYRELLYFLVWRDLKVRYKHAVLGGAWAVLQPVMSMIAFSIFFGRIAGVGSDGIPYPLFSFAALLPWTFFSDGLRRASESLVESANLVRKVYFPRVLVPASAVLGAFVDFVIASLVLAVLLAGYGVAPSSRMLLLPVLAILTFAAASAVGLWLAALNVTYRDVRYVVPFVIQLWMFVTPVIYPTSAVIRQLESLGIPGWVYALNPMVGIVEGFRWSLWGSVVRPATLLGVSVLSTAGVLVAGLRYFRSAERSFADVI